MRPPVWPRCGSGAVRRTGTAQADHLVSADVGVRLRRRVRGRAARRAPGRDRRRRGARGTAGVRDQPGGERLVRSPCRCDQRAAPPDPVRPHARALGPLHRDCAGRCSRCVVATALGPWGFGAAVVGLALAWAYSAPPLRLKQNGWWGNAAVGACYEGLPWITGAAVMAAAHAGCGRSSSLALLYSVGAHGIMTLNDFKSVEGDSANGHRLAAGAAGRRARRPRGLHVHGRAAGVVVALLLVLGTAGRTPGIVAAAARRAARADERCCAAPRERATWYSAHRRHALRRRHAGQRIRVASMSAPGRSQARMPMSAQRGCP